MTKAVSWLPQRRPKKIYQLESAVYQSSWYGERRWCCKASTCSNKSFAVIPFQGMEYQKHNFVGYFSFQTDLWPISKIAPEGKTTFATLQLYSIGKDFWRRIGKIRKFTKQIQYKSNFSLCLYKAKVHFNSLSTVCTQ